MWIEKKHLSIVIYCAQKKLKSNKGNVECRREFWFIVIFPSFSWKLPENKFIYEFYLWTISSQTTKIPSVSCCCSFFSFLVWPFIKFHYMDGIGQVYNFCVHFPSTVLKIGAYMRWIYMFTKVQLFGFSLCEHFDGISQLKIHYANVENNKTSPGKVAAFHFILLYTKTKWLCQTMKLLR